MPGGHGQTLLPGGQGQTLMPGGHGQTLMPGGHGQTLMPGGHGQTLLPGGKVKPKAGGQINVLPTKGSQGKLGGMDTSRTDDVNTDKTDGPT